MAERIKLGEMRPPAGHADVFQSDDLVQTFADGIQGLLFSGALAKIDFYQTTPTPFVDPTKALMVGADAGAPEQRVVTMRVALPTRQLLEFCVSSLILLKSNDIKGPLSRELDLMLGILNKIEFKP